MEKFKQFVIANQHLPPIEFEKIVTEYQVTSKISMTDRCTARLSSGSQCSRRKQQDNKYCGTHKTKTPYGSIDDVNPPINVWLQNIDGIFYYVDEKRNVFKVEDIEKGINKPFTTYVQEGETLKLFGN